METDQMRKERDLRWDKSNCSSWRDGNWLLSSLKITDRIGHKLLLN